MSAPRIRIVVADDEPLARERLRRLLLSEKELLLVGEASDGPEAVSLIRQQRPQIALLDIRLPGLNGFEVLARLGKQAPPAVIFVTAYQEYAIPAFEAEVVDYLLKPFIAARFREALQRARDRCLAGRADLRLDTDRAARPGRIALRSGLRRMLVPLDEIQYAVAANNRCEVTTTRESFKVSESLGSLEARLPRETFVRISRFALVNLSYVTAIEPKSHGDQHLLLRNNHHLTVARTHRTQLLARLNRIKEPAAGSRTSRALPPGKVGSR